MPPLDTAQSDGWVTVPPAASAAAAASGAPASDNDGWVTVPPAEQHWAAPAGGEFGDLNAQASASATPQSLVGAGVNALGQGVVSGVGSLVGGAGDIAKAGDVPWSRQVLKALDLVDEGKNRDAYQKLTDAQRQQVGAYRGASPEDKAAQRVALQQTIDDHDKPNLAQRAGSAIEQAAPGVFPVDPAQEGHVTGAMRMVGGVGPLLAGGALGGPAGLLASAAAIGAQTFHGTRADALAHGASDDDADSAAGKAALGQMAAMSIPIAKVLQVIPVPLRDGFLKTIVNAGRSGVELGAGNTLGTLAQNYVASQTYDPERSVFKGTGDAGIDGFLAGLVVHGAGAAVGAARAPAASRAPAATVPDVMAASDVDGAIAAAQAVAQAPSGAPAPDATGIPPAAVGEPSPAAPGAATSFGQLFGAGPMGDAGGGHVPTLTLASGRKVPARFDVAEGSDLVPASGDLQPRDRAGRMASSAQIVDMANNLDPELLHASPGPDQGAPTVNADGVILAGNGRTRAIRQAYALGNGDPYRAMVERYGFDTSGMSEPVLIRRIDQQMTPEENRQIAVESNVSAGQRLSGTEQAAIDARSLTPNLLSLYNPMLSGGPTAAGNRDFVRSWVGTLPQSERNSVMGANGAISADGVRRLQGAMLSMAFGDKGTLSRSLESTDDTTRALTGALTDAAPAWAQLQAGITGGRIPPDLAVAPQLLRAVELVRQAREKGQSVGDVLGQADAFNPIDPVTAAFVRAFYNPTLTHPASRPFVADVLRRYATEAAKASPDPGLFGDAEPAVAPADILATVVAAARKDPPVMPMAEPIGTAMPPGGEALGAPAAQPAAGGAAAPIAPAMQPETRSVGAAASRDMTAPHLIAMSPREFAANRYQGEVERLALPPQPNDRTVYIQDPMGNAVKSTLAEVTGDPVVAMDQAYNRQQPEALTHHIERENKTADGVADYYAETAGSAPTLLRKEQARDATAARNIQAVFGDPQSVRPPADPSPTLKLMDGMLDNPRQAERNSVIKTLSALAAKFYNADGTLKSDPYALYGIGEHINDLLNGAGDTETNGAARVLKRELMQIKESLYNDIEGAAPGFASYRADYQRDSQAISAMKLLQDSRLTLLSGTSQHITPAKWFSFMRGIVEGRADPMDPAASLSEDQMDRLWNITDQLKRQTFIDAGKPRGSWTSMMQEWGGRFARLAAHGVAAHSMPIIGNMGVEMAVAGLRRRSVNREMQRLLNPDLGLQMDFNPDVGQQATPADPHSLRLVPAGYSP